MAHAAIAQAFFLGRYKADSSSGKQPRPYLTLWINHLCRREKAEPEPVAFVSVRQ
jgi:hypothetical protein